MFVKRREPWQVGWKTVIVVGFPAKRKGGLGEKERAPILDIHTQGLRGGGEALAAHEITFSLGLGSSWIEEALCLGVRGSMCRGKNGSEEVNAQKL